LQRGDDDAVSFEFLNMTRGDGEDRGDEKRGRHLSVCPSLEKGMYRSLLGLKISTRQQQAQKRKKSRFTVNTGVIN
jgi:hypothetical protein